MPGPFPAITVEAVGACSRTLAGCLSRRGVSKQCSRCQTPRPSAGFALGDRLAIRQRFHDPDVHRRHQPATGSPPISSRPSKTPGSMRRRALDGRHRPQPARNRIAPTTVRDGSPSDSRRRPAPPERTSWQPALRVSCLNRYRRAERPAADRENQPRFAAAARLGHRPLPRTFQQLRLRRGLANASRSRRAPSHASFPNAAIREEAGPRSGRIRERRKARMPRRPRARLSAPATHDTRVTRRTPRPTIAS